MSSTESPRGAAPAWVLGGGVLALAVVGLVWAKWAPYAVKVPSVAGSHDLGDSILAGSGRGGPPPGVSLGGGLEFAADYFVAIWPALVVGLVLAAAVSVALPADWLRRAFGRSATTGAALAVPSMMCSCCAAPLAVGLRARAAGLTSTLAYWLANPALNPVVLAFCAFVLPWPWTLLRAGAGLVVVVAAVALARRSETTVDPDVAAQEPADPDTRALPVRFLAALGRFAVRLLPEYLLLVVALGALRGVLFPVGTPLVAGSVGVVAAVTLVAFAVGGTLLPVPTGAEIAIIAALLAVGVSGPIAAALLITLPALSLPSVLMVRRVFPKRLLVAITGTVAVIGLLTTAVAALVGL